MAIAQSKLTAQGQISVPAEVRRLLGVGPGAMLEWDEEDGRIVVRRAGRYTCADIHRAVFGERKVTYRSPAALKAGIRQHMKKKHAGR